MEVKTYFMSFDDNLSRRGFAYEIGKTYAARDNSNIHVFYVDRYLSNILNHFQNYLRICLVEASNIANEYENGECQCLAIKILRELTIDEIVETLIFEGRSMKFINSLYPHYQIEKGKKLTNVVINQLVEKTYYKVFDKNLCAYNGHKFEVGKEYVIDEIVPNGNFNIYQRLKGRINQEYIRVCKVEPVQLCDVSDIKSLSCMKIRIVKELTKKEVVEQLKKERFSKVAIIKFLDLYENDCLATF